MTIQKTYTILKWVIIGSVILILLGLTVLTNMDPDAAYQGKHIPTTEKTVTIVLIDGLSKEIFNEELEAGNLPNIQSLISRSTLVDHGIVSFPSMTGYAFYPFITGMDASRSGIYGLRWFDRSLELGNLRNYVGRTNIQMNNDVTGKYKNLFEYFDDYYTASINTYMNRGVHHSLKTGWAHTTAKYSQVSIFPALRAIPLFGEDMSKDHFEHESLVTDLAISQLERNPKVQWITYPSLDAHNHVHGTDGIYIKLMRHLDKQIGKLVSEINRLYQDDRMLVIVSDHGISDVETNVDLPRILQDSLKISLERGPSAHLNTDELITPIQTFVEKDGFFVINGNLSAYLYMRDPEGSGKDAWRSRLTGFVLENYPSDKDVVDLPGFISEIEGIEFVLYKNGGNVILRSKSGNAEIRHQNDSLSYHPTSGDPLELLDYLDPYTFYSYDSVLLKTAESDYPYALARIWDLMCANDAPDIVLTTRGGYDLAHNYEIFVDNYKGGHGGIHKSLLNVPFILYIPEVKAKHIKSARSEDIGATILEYLDMEVEYPLSGKSILLK